MPEAAAVCPSRRVVGRSARAVAILNCFALYRRLVKRPAADLTQKGTTQTRFRAKLGRSHALHPGFERAEPCLCVLRLSGLVILAADNQDVDRVAVVAAQLGVRRAVQADVVIRIVRIPVERRRDRARLDSRANRVGVIRRLLGVNRDEIVERRVGGDDDRSGGIA